MGMRVNYRVEYYSSGIGCRWFKTLRQAIDFAKKVMKPEYAEKCYIYKSEYDNDKHGTLIRLFTSKNKYVLEHLL